MYAEDKKTGYVANNERAKFELTSSASELQDKIGNTARAEYLAYLFRPTDLQYYDMQLYIGRIIRYTLLNIKPNPNYDGFSSGGFFWFNIFIFLYGYCQIFN